MRLQLTKKTIDWLKVNIEEINTENDFYTWHVNYQIVNRKKFVILMNNLTRFSVVLFGVTKKQLMDEQFMINTIFHAFILNDYEPKLIENYLQKFDGKITFLKTSNRKLVAQLNRMMEDSLSIAYSEGINFDLVEQIHITEAINDLIVGENNNKVYYVPKKKMREYLELFNY